VVGERGDVVGLITLEDVMSEVFGALSDDLKDSLRSRPRKRPGAGA
jgi:CBS domain containing-hemolysin-like protein